MNINELNNYNHLYRRKTVINYINHDIVVNGDINKAVWKKCKNIGELKYPWHKKGDIYSTEIKMLWSDTYFYVLFDCEDRNAYSAHTEHNSAVCRDSCVEIFISPDPCNISEYYTFETNCCGIMLNEHKNYLRKKSEWWLPAGVKTGKTVRSMTVKSKQSMNRWAIELAIPFYLFNGATGKKTNPPVDGAKWRLNVMRCGDTKYKQWGIWSENRNKTPNFHLPQYFGEVIFKKN